MKEKKNNYVIEVCIKDINLEGECQAETKRWKVYQTKTL